MRLHLLIAGVLPALASAQFHLYFLPGPQGLLRSHAGLAEAPSPRHAPPAVAAAAAAAQEEEVASTRGVGALREVYAWRQMDFEFESEAARQQAIASGTFDPSGTLPLGVEVWGARLFLALPRWRSGSPATLAWVPRDPRDAGGLRSPRLRPFPSWGWHGRSDCQGLVSVFRMAVDACGRLWVLDSGAVDVVTSLRQACPPKVVVFDLRTDTEVARHELPADQYKDGSLFSNIVLDVRGEHCEDTAAFLADVWRFGLVTFSLRQGRSWRAEHSFFLPDPLRTDYDLQGLQWTWRDGVFGLALAAPRRDGDRIVYFHSMSSHREFTTLASVLRTENATDVRGNLRPLSEPRGTSRAQASAAQIDRQGVMFYTLVHRNAIGCWNSNHPEGFRTALQGVVAQDDEALLFPNDLKLDQDSSRQALWAISNRLPFFLYSQLDPNDVNFRVFTAPVDELVQGTVCDPQHPPLGVRPAPPTCDA